MRLIALIARRPFEYDGRRLVAGQRFAARPIDAAVLTYRHQAAFAGAVPAPAPADVCTPAVAQAEDRPRRARRRRDESAEE